VISTIIIRFANRLTIAFALTAGLSPVRSLHLVVLGGLTELFAGATYMELGNFLAAITRDKHYHVEEAQEWKEVDLYPQAEEDEIYIRMAKYGLVHGRVQLIMESVCANKSV
jgi:hypothetical protein